MSSRAAHLERQPNTFRRSSSLTMPSPLAATPASAPQYPSRTARPRLRIITSLPPKLYQPIPIRHPNLVKSAPLQPPPTVYPQQHNDERSLMVHLSIENDDGSDDSSHLGRTQAKPGHRRRLSEKFKHLFTSIRAGRDHSPPPHPLISRPHIIKREVAKIRAFPTYPRPDETPFPPIPPSRPRRSPGTVSFLVSRQPSRPDYPASTSPSSSLSSCPTRLTDLAEVDRDHQFIELEISHFSDATSSPSCSCCSRSSLVSAMSSRVSVKESLMRERPALPCICTLCGQGYVFGANLRRSLSLPEYERIYLKG